MFDLDIVRFVSAMNEKQENEFFEEAKAQGLINEELACIIRANAKVARLNANSSLFMAMKGVADILKVKNPDLWKPDEHTSTVTENITAVNCRCCL